MTQVDFASYKSDYEKLSENVINLLEKKESINKKIFTMNQEGKGSAFSDYDWLLPILMQILRSDSSFFVTKDFIKITQFGEKTELDIKKCTKMKMENKHVISDSNIQYLQFEFFEFGYLVLIRHNNDIFTRYDLITLEECMQMIPRDSLYEMDNIRLEKEDFIYERYYWARYRGEWDYLCRASEDVIALRDEKQDTFTKPVNCKKKNLKTFFSKMPTEKFIIDYLDSINISTQKIFEISKDTIKIGILESNLDLNEVYLTITDHHQKTILVSPNWKGAQLSIYRYLIRMIDQIFTSIGFNALERELINNLLQLIQGNIYDNFLIKIPYERGISLSFFSNFEDRIDLLRTYWLFFLFSNKSKYGMKEYLIKDLAQRAIDETEKTINLMLFYYPTKNLEINSDFLHSYQVTKILRSDKLLSKYSHIFQKSENKIKNVSDQTQSRFIEVLSLNILYSLHFLRFDYRRKLFIEIENQNPHVFEFSKNAGKVNEGYAPETKLKISEKLNKDCLPIQTQNGQFTFPPFIDHCSNQSFSFTEGQLFLLTEYAYEEIGLPRNLNIYAHLTRQMEFELPLYTSNEYYRDHLYHVMDVCLLGDFLLGAQFKNKPLFETISERKKYDKINFMKNWYFAALFHDIGYVIEQSEKFINPLLAFEGKTLSSFVESSLTGFKNGKESVRQGLLENWGLKNYIIPDDLRKSIIGLRNPIDHGVVAWIYMLSIFNKNSIDIEQYALGMNAIARHNLTNPIISFASHPISFLLILCDNLQEWGRAKIIPAALSRGFVEGLRFNNPPLFDRQMRSSSIILTNINPYKIDGLIQYSINEKQGISIIIPFQDSSRSKFEPSINWLLFTNNFQSISIDKNRPIFPIKVILENPISSINLDLHYCEMDIFEEYVRENENAHSLLTWIENARGGKSGINYYVNNFLKSEVFEIDLSKIINPIVYPLSPDQWTKFYKWKWSWVEHRYMQDQYGKLLPSMS